MCRGGYKRDSILVCKIIHFEKSSEWSIAENDDLRNERKDGEGGTLNGVSFDVVNGPSRTLTGT